MAAVLLPTPIHICNLNSGTAKVAKVAPAAQHTHGVCNQMQRKWTIGRMSQTGDAKSILNSKVFAASQSSIDPVQPSLNTNDKSEDLKKQYSYLFRTETGGLVKVVVGDRFIKYSVDIEVSSLSKSGQEHDLVLGWSMFRSDSSSLYIPESPNSSLGTLQFSFEGGLDSVRMPFVKNSLERHTINLEFDSTQVPFYLSFLLHSLSDAASSESVIRSHRKTNFCVPVGIGPGSPMPLGVSVSNDGFVNFALFSRNADGVILCLYSEETSQPSLEIELDPYVNRTGDIWHISMVSVGQFVRYGYRCKGTPLWDHGSRFHMRHILLDPYAKRIEKFTPDQGEVVSLTKYLGCLVQGPIFDWTGDVHPRLPMEKLVVYRLNVDQFTKDDSSGLPEDVAGTFLGVTEKLQHFKTLGINAILLEPVFSFDEQKSPYLPYHFFSPMHSYGRARDGLSAISSLKMMVKTLHAQGMEVLLEVVFTHTAEGGDADSQTISFRGIDNSSYYLVDGDMISGVNNAFKCSSPVVQQILLDILRHWVLEFHIDGFCFMNASALTKGSDGKHLSRPPLVEAIAFDPILSNTKVIADCWSPLDMSYKETRFPHWKRWAEMNLKFCTDIRNFLRGEAPISDLATRLCGSGDIFSASRGPAFSFNYVTKNFGLSLVDLVSFSSLELASELSWNCGEEGPTNNNCVLERRVKQIRNFLFVLFVSLGVPVLNMGDEFGYSTGGSLLYSDRKPINWNSLQTRFGIQITQFIAFLSSFRRRRSDVFERREFLKVESIDWRGSDQSPPKWEDLTCKFLAMILKAEEDDKLSSSDKGDLFIAFNASDLPESVVLPELPEGIAWLHLVDTSKPFPGFFLRDSDSDDINQVAGLSTYELLSHTCALFESKKSSSST